MSFSISPIGNDQFFDSNGNLLVGGQLFTYLEGTSTKVATYTNILGNSNHTNPIILNASGLPTAAPIYIAGGIGYKFVLAPASDTDPPSSPIYTWDNVKIVDADSLSVQEWVSGSTPTYISATSFSVVGDQTATYQIGRRVKMITTIATYYGWITASVFGSVTTVTVVLDSGSLDATLHTLSYSILTGQNTSVPNMRHSGNNTTVAADFTTLGDVIVAGQDVKADDGASASTFMQFWVRVSSTLRAAWKLISTSASNAIFTHANSADRTYTFPNRDTTVDAGDMYMGPSACGSGSTRTHEGNVTISASQSLNGIHFYTNFTLDAGDTITVDNGVHRLVIVASESITINGTIDALGAGAIGGVGTPNGNGSQGATGFSQVGGGGGANTHTGGRGGDIAIHSVERRSGGAGGVPTGGGGTAGTSETAELIAIAHPYSIMGGAGGGGGGANNGDAGGAGGRGGGSIVLIAPIVTLGVDSALTTSGAAGLGSGNGAGDGGGGGAGNIYIICRSYTDNGCVFTMAGGAGGNDGSGGPGGAGAAGVKQILNYI